MNPHPAPPRTAPGRLRGLVVLGVAVALTAAGCQGGTDSARSAASSSASTTTTSTTTTSTATPPTTTSTTTAPPPPVAVGPAPEGPVANPWPGIGPASPGHHAILAMGDSLMGEAVFTLPATLAAHGFDAVVYDAHVNASGLLDPMNGSSARDYLAQQLAAHPDVDTVMFEWVGVCAVACGPGTFTYGSPAFFAAWQAAAGDLVRDVRSRGLEVLWAISSPPPPDVTGEAPVEDWSSLSMRVLVATTLTMYERRYPDELGVATTDWWQALSDTSGQWQNTLWYDDALHTVLLDDRVHLTEEGSTRASTWTVAALATLYAS